MNINFEPSELMSKYPMLATLTCHLKKIIAEKPENQTESQLELRRAICWCKLATWSGHSAVNWSKPIQKVRFLLTAGEKIFCELSCHQQQITLHNQTKTSIFISSVTLDSSDFLRGIWTVERVTPGQKIVAFDWIKFRKMLLLQKTDSDSLKTKLPGQLSLKNSSVLLISTHKGWGPGYHRRDFVQCELRYELWLNDCWIDFRKSSHNEE